MKKIIYTIMSIIEVCLLVGAYIVHYYTVRRMGMLRHVIYINQKIESSYPVSVIRIIVVVFFVITTALILLLFIKNRKKYPKVLLWINTQMLITTIITLVFVLSFSTEVLRAYYLISALIIITGFLQIIITAIASKVYTKH
ncbi:MAG: hypothetical protein ACK5LL_00850 [Suipraeoptans sp.]